MSGNRPVALVTGAAHRIGAAIAADLAANGFCVAIHHRSDRAEAEALAAAISETGGNAHIFAADLTDDDAVRDMAANITDRIGPIRLLVNNASVFEEDSVTGLDRTVWDDHFAVHLRAPSILAEAMAAALPEELPGLIVSIIDQRVLKLTPRFFSYTLSKSALWTATRTMAQALAPQIRVNAIGPGPTLPSPRQDPLAFAKQVENVPLKRAPELSEFGATIRYFWNTPSVTGQMIALDGGQHLAWQTPDVTDVPE